ncbi:unnamed protein product [Clonostachys solani]|uniref:Quinate repressor protein n=1 Tax=Clonostachys solani TaxID=160281 RepID=A0A9N9ZGM9_9HYPO|nr:unnamed protein product [Clonostachys solani]
MAGVKRPFEAVLDHDRELARCLSPPCLGADLSRSVSPSPGAFFSPHEAKSRKQDGAVTSLLSPFMPTTRDFSPDASMLLVGIRGAGKTTLAVMASTAMNRKVIDLEIAFLRTTGFSSTEYKAKYGILECHQTQAQVLRTMLNRHRQGYVLVCSWMHGSAQKALREFSTTNPVIHILREGAAIEKLLQVSEKSKVWNLLRVSNTVFRSSTTFEFLNISEEASPSSTKRPPPPHLALKHVERHFLKFLSSIYPAGSFPYSEPALPLSAVPLEKRRFTYAVSLPLSDVLQDHFDMEKQVIGADAVQITVDSLSKSPITDQAQLSQLPDSITAAVGRVRRDTVLPVIVHIILPNVESQETVKTYLELLWHSIRLAPNKITVDLRVDISSLSAIVASRNRTKIIGHLSTESSENPHWSSPFWKSFYRKAQELECHFVRFLRLGQSVEDNLEITSFRNAVAGIKGPAIPLIAYNLGPLGWHSATMNQFITEVYPDSTADASHEPTSSKMGITTVDATTALFASFFFHPLQFYVFGAYVNKSLSPAMITAGFKACGIPHRYSPHSSKSLQNLEHLLRHPNFGGASIGHPFKIEAISLTSALSDHAKAIGAVNTLIPIRHLNSDGTVPEQSELFKTSANQTGAIKALYGENTDWIGIRACIRRGLSPANAVSANTCGLVIGAGGMARATIYAMLQLGIKDIVIHNRTQANAEAIVSHFRSLLEQQDLPTPLSESGRTRFIILSLDEPWPEDVRLPTVIVSCIPNNSIGSGLSPHLTLPDAWLGSRTGGIVIELGYTTLNTSLLEQVREKSKAWITMDGMDVLPEQGFAQFEFYTGRRPPRKIMRRAVLESFEEGSPKPEAMQLRLMHVDHQEQY